MSESIYLQCSDCSGLQHWTESDSIRNRQEDLINLVDNWHAIKAIYALNEKMKVYEIRMEFEGDILSFLSEHYDEGHEIKVVGYETYKVYPRQQVAETV